jgi:two-component system sensor histidine kinase QseC
VHLYKRSLVEIDELWDAHLEHTARVLLAMATASAERGDLETLRKLLPRIVPARAVQLDGIDARGDVPEGDRNRSLAFQLFKGDGSFRLSSRNAPQQPLSEGILGFSSALIGDTRWRVYGIADPIQDLVLYVAENHAARERLASHIIEHLILPTVLVIPLLLALIWIAASKGLAPLARLTRELRRRDPLDLQPLKESPMPVDIEPLITTLNSLFKRLQLALENERQFTGNAAHELRTPVAALRLQAQVAQRATSDEKRQRALGQIVIGADRATRLIEQLLLLARLDVTDRIPAPEPVNLLGVAERTIAELEPMARDRAVRLQAGGSSDAVTPGDDTCLGMLMRNLIDNAVRYTPAGGSVEVLVRASEPFNRVTVTDTGPGIDVGQHTRMLERFRRGPDTTEPGTGLGLSIARRICEIHRGSLMMENCREGGLCCEVRLPPSAEHEQSTD